MARRGERRADGDLPGRRFASSASSAQLFHGVLALAVSTEGVAAIMQIGSKSEYLMSLRPA